MNPNAPISIAKSWTVHPLSFRLVFKFAYLLTFRRFASIIFLSNSTVFSNQIIRFFDTEWITISGRCKVSTDVSGGIVLLLLKSKVICQSVGESVWRMDNFCFFLGFGLVPFLIKFWAIFFFLEMRFVGLPLWQYQQNVCGFLLKHYRVSKCTDFGLVQRNSCLKYGLKWHILHDITGIYHGFCTPICEGYLGLVMHGK